MASPKYMPSIVVWLISHIMHTLYLILSTTGFTILVHITKRSIYTFTHLVALFEAITILHNPQFKDSSHAHVSKTNIYFSANFNCFSAQKVENCNKVGENYLRHRRKTALSLEKITIVRLFFKMLIQFRIKLY